MAPGSTGASSCRLTFDKHRIAARAKAERFGDDGHFLSGPRFVRKLVVAPHTQNEFRRTLISSKELVVPDADGNVPVSRRQHPRRRERGGSHRRQRAEPSEPARPRRPCSVPSPRADGRPSKTALMSANKSSMLSIAAQHVMAKCQQIVFYRLQFRQFLDPPGNPPTRLDAQFGGNLPVLQ